MQDNSSRPASAASSPAVHAGNQGSVIPASTASLLLLPPVHELEQYVLQDARTQSTQGGESAENLVHILPDLTEAIGGYARLYPEQVGFVWSQLKPILKDIRRRNKLHGRGQHRPRPPVCAKQPYTWENCHGEEIHDDYAWLTDKDDPLVMQYLEQENTYADACLSHTKTLQKVLFKEFVSRLDENDESAKVTLSDGWAYYSRKAPGCEYRQHCRVDKSGNDEVYLDENKVYQQLMDETENGVSFFHVGFLRHSPDSRLVAYGVDINGSERYTAYLLDIETKELLTDVLPDCYEDFEFGPDGEHVYYVRIDGYERAYQLRKHRFGTKVDDDEVLYQEDDEMFYLTMTKSCNKRFIFMNTSAQVTSETRVLDLETPGAKLRVLFPRRENYSYTIEHHGFPDSSDPQEQRGYFYIMTNENAKNLTIFRVPVPSDEEWDTKYALGMPPDVVNSVRETVVEARDFVMIEAFQVRQHHLIIFERSNCMQNIRVITLDPNEPGFDNYHYVSFPDSIVYSIFPGSVDEEVADLTKSTMFHTNLIRFTYTSFTQPKQVVDYNMDTRTKTVVHEERVLGPGFDATRYVSKRLWATGVDGTAVPISLVYRRDLLNQNSQEATSGNPLLLNGYGAYGCCVQPLFNAARLSLIDRGFVFAVAHIRGGSDMGNGWYDTGKLAKKPNTFHDFISCAEFLIQEGYTSKEKLAIYGRSAGGLLIGAVVNMRPDLFKAALAEVPFVDVINTMFDSTIPWTAFEYEEWGNPADRQIYDIMMSYCPYTNIIPGQIYPNMLIVAGMNDPRVAYFEPAKWTAKLRSLAKWSTGSEPKTSSEETPITSSTAAEDPESDRVLLLRVQDVGHSGSSGQYSYLEDLSFEYAFLISILGARFRPISTGIKGFGGVDYDQYWEELEQEYGLGDEEDEEEDAEEKIRTPSTPLQRFSEFWKRRTLFASKRNEVKSPGEKKSRRSASISSSASVASSQPATAHHKRSRSFKKGLDMIRNFSRGGSTVEVTAAESIPETQIENTSSSDLTSTEPSSAESTTKQGTITVNGEIISTVSSKDKLAALPGGKNRAPPPRSPSMTPSGSKASLRHQLYPTEDDTGRVQKTGRVYQFLSKFW